MSLFGKVRAPIIFRTLHNNIKIETKPILYGDEASPPVRFVMMTASKLDIPLRFHRVDLFTSENQLQFYKKINYLQKVPALVTVEKTVVCDSHAIALYLCQISKVQDLYPNDPLTKAAVDQMLFFNSSSLFPIDSSIFTEFFAGKWPIDENKVKKWNFLLGYLEKRLTDSDWLTGDKMYLCDLCCATTISSLQLLLPNRHEKVGLWLKKLHALPFFEINKRGLKRLNSFIKKIR